MHWVQINTGLERYMLSGEGHLRNEGEVLLLSAVTVEHMSLFALNHTCLFADLKRETYVEGECVC